jgi:hypothetical protein
MNDWNDKPTMPPRLMRFVAGEIAILIADLPPYTGTPVEVVEVGPFKCGACPNVHDYHIACCDGRKILVDDPDLKKFEPPAEDISEEETNELEETV